jgi:hypothetical protein
MLALLRAVSTQAQTPAPAALSADLAVQFICKERTGISIEESFVPFLKNHNFRVLNEAKIQREHGYHLLNLYIIAMDYNDILIQINLMPPTDDTFSLALTTPPPTNRLNDLESGLLSFVSERLGCQIRSVTRGENGIERSGFFNEHEVKRFETLWREAQELKEEPAH